MLFFCPFVRYRNYFINPNLPDKSQSATLAVAGTSNEVKGINETSISVLGFTGLNPIIPIAGLAILLVGFIFLIIEAERKRKIRIISYSS